MNFRGQVVIGWFYANDGGCERMVAVFYGDKHGHGLSWQTRRRKFQHSRLAYVPGTRNRIWLDRPREPLQPQIFPVSDRGTHLHRRCIKAWTGGQPGKHTESTWR